MLSKSGFHASTGASRYVCTHVKTKISLLLALLALLGPVASTFAVGMVQIPDRFKGIVLFAPEPDYQRFVGGTFTVRAQGVYRLTINPTSGVVDEVGVLKRCGEQRLDAAAVMAFMQWKFKPGAIKQLDVPIIYDRFVDVRLSRAAIHQK